MTQIKCSCGCNEVVPDLFLVALESQFHYGGPGHTQDNAALDQPRVCRNVVPFPTRPNQPFRKAA